jgi:hypothetical protein
MNRPLAIDLYCGLGGWTEGLLAEGYEVVGFDIERHRYPARDMGASEARKVRQNGVDFNNPNVGSSTNRSFNYANQCAVRDAPLTGGWVEYPAQLVLQDVLTLHGSQFKDATLIVASPPCQAYSYRAMPWKRAKALPPPDNTLFEACFRIQREACEAAGRHVPLVVENVRGAQKWVGRARWNYGSFYLWGDVPALMPMTGGRTTMKAGFSHQPGGATIWEAYRERQARKLPGFRFDGSGRSFQSASVEETSIKGIPHRTAGHWTNPAEHEAFKQVAPVSFEARQRPAMTEQSGGNYWFQEGASRHASRSPARKAASAMIAKIPLPLSRHIAAVYHP